MTNTSRLCIEDNFLGYDTKDLTGSYWLVYVYDGVTTFVISGKEDHIVGAIVFKNTETEITLHHEDYDVYYKAFDEYMKI